MVLQYLPTLGKDNLHRVARGGVVSVNPCVPRYRFGTGFDFACIKWHVMVQSTPFQVLSSHEHRVDKRSLAGFGTILNIFRV